MLKATVNEGVSSTTIDFRNKADQFVLRVEVWEADGEVKWDADPFPTSDRKPPTR